MPATRCEGVLLALAARLMLGEAVAAVDRPVLAGLERDLAGVAAVGADGVVHLAGTAASVATAAVAAATSLSASASALGLAAGGAALGVLVFTLRVVLLVVRAEDEL